MDENVTAPVVEALFPTSAQVLLQPTEQKLKGWKQNIRVETPFHGYAPWRSDTNSGKIIFKLPPNFISTSESHLEFVLRVPATATGASGEPNRVSYLENAYSLFKTMRVISAANQQTVLELKRMDLYQNLQFAFTTEDWLLSQGKFGGLGLTLREKEELYGRDEVGDLNVDEAHDVKLMCKFDCLFRWRGLLPLEFFEPELIMEFELNDYNHAFCFATVGADNHTVTVGATAPTQAITRYEIVEPRLVMKQYFPDESFRRLVQDNMRAAILDPRRGMPLLFKKYKYDLFSWPVDQNYIKYNQMIGDITAKAVFVVFTKEDAGSDQWKDPFTNSNFIYPCAEAEDELEVHLSVGGEEYPAQGLKVSKTQSTQAYSMLLDAIGRENDYINGTLIDPKTYIREYEGRDEQLERVNKRPFAFSAIGATAAAAAVADGAGFVAWWAGVKDELNEAIESTHRSPFDQDHFILGWNLETDKDLRSGKVAERIQIEFRRASKVVDPDTTAAMPLHGHVFIICDAVNSVSATQIRDVDMTY